MYMILFTFNLRTDRFVIVLALTDGYAVTDTLLKYRTYRADINRLVRSLERRVGKIHCRVHRNALIRAAADELEYMLAVHIAGGTHTPSAEDAAIAVDEDIGMGCIQLTFRELIGQCRCCNAEPVRQRLQFAVTALVAEHAEVIAFYEQHLDDTASDGIDFRCVVFDDDTRSYWLRTGSLGASINEDCANTAASVGYEPFHVAQARDIYSGILGSLENRLSGCSLDFLTIDNKGNCIAHCSPFMIGNEPTNVQLSLRNP